MRTRQVAAPILNHNQTWRNIQLQLPHCTTP